MGDTLKVIITIVIIGVAIYLLTEGISKMGAIPIGVGVFLILRALWKNE